jgi:hypothetical protein
VSDPKARSTDPAERWQKRDDALLQRRMDAAADAAHELTCTPWYRLAKRRRLIDDVAFQTTAVLRALTSPAHR